jgi:3-oxoacyl-[acyl-carrier protein] reductase
MLEGRVALVTGASRGIGRVTALALAEQGADLVVSARSAELLGEVAAQIESLGRRVLAVVADVEKSADIDALIEQAIATFGRIDILVNNAGITRTGFSIPI